MSKFNVLLISKNYKDYIAKVWWSIQKGLMNTCNLYTFGEGQRYDKKVTTYKEILEMMPVTMDAVIIDKDFKNSIYIGLEDISCKKAVIIGDYWSLPESFYSEILPNVDYIFSFFYEFILKHPKIYFLPPSVDTDIFKDWKMNKKYLVGFLGKGCTSLDDNYPERYEITTLLKEQYGRFFYSPFHPGWGYFNDKESLVGNNFSKAINKCRMIVNTSGIIRHCNPKYIEFSASGSMLLAGECNHLDKIHFEDGYNCVQFKTNEELLHKIDYYTHNNNEANAIIFNAMKTIEQYHTSEVRAKEMLEILKG